MQLDLMLNEGRICGKSIGEITKDAMMFGLVKMHCTVVRTMKIIHMLKAVYFAFHKGEKKNKQAEEG